ncbi:MAG: hypothetical protein F9K32_13070 [Desulfobulbaceae bacterium]|nr:MAG: hypothetical protein F9K32_13070 [Desulfobulbaceae bacterium]
MEGYSEQAQSLLDLLTEQEVLQLRKHHPFKVDRNEKIRELHRRGVAQYVIAEICGMRRETVGRICNPEQYADQA